MACSPAAPAVAHALQLCASVLAVLCDAQQLLLLNLAQQDHAQVGAVGGGYAGAVVGGYAGARAWVGVQGVESAGVGCTRSGCEGT